MSRTTSRSLVAGLWLATLAPAFAASPPPDDPPLTRPAARAAPAPPRREPRAETPGEPSRRRDLEDLRRRDVAASLAKMGAAVDWKQHTLRELLEWRARAEAAESLRAESGVKVDWRSQSLERLLDMRLRAHKAAELRTAFGVGVEWQRYSLAELDAMGKTIAKLRPRARGIAAIPGQLLPPTFARPERQATADPDGVIRPRFNARAAFRPDERDPDAVIRPRFAARPGRFASGQSPDDLMAPSFGAFRRSPLDRSARPSDPDDLIDPR
jgi:hypothetical protein